MANYCGFYFTAFGEFPKCLESLSQKFMSCLVKIYDATVLQLFSIIDATFYCNFSTFSQLDQNFRSVVLK